MVVLVPVVSISTVRAFSGLSASNLSLRSALFFFDERTLIVVQFSTKTGLDSEFLDFF